MNALCPYCSTKLNKTPLRKTKCPACSQYIYVRKGKLVTEQSAFGGKREVLSSPVVAGTKKEIASSNNLEKDLEKYAHEFYTQGDLDAGKQILIEVVGVVGLGGLVVSLFTMALPPLGITVGTGTIVYAVMKATEAYADATTEQRKAIRAAVKWLKGGFKLDNLAD